MKKKTKAVGLPPQPSGHDLNVGDLVYVAIEDKFGIVTFKEYRFDPIRSFERRIETADPSIFNKRKHVRANDLLTIRSVEGDFARGSIQYDSFHCHRADQSFRDRYFVAALQGLDQRMEALSVADEKA